jgi:hypothetical protein
MFIDHLELMGISPKKYLRIARKSAKENGYDPDLLQFSNKKNKKLMYNNDDEIIHFGASAYKDFILYNILTNPEEANKRRDLYHKRALKLAKKSDKYSASNLSLYILW